MKMKLNKLVKRLKQILVQIDTLEKKVNYINKSSDELDKMISVLVASDKGNEIKELSKLIGNPCPCGVWEKCYGEWVPGSGWVRVRINGTLQYFKLDKIDFDFIEE